MRHCHRMKARRIFVSKVSVFDAEDIHATKHCEKTTIHSLYSIHSHEIKSFKIKLLNSLHFKCTFYSNIWPPATKYLTIKPSHKKHITCDWKPVRGLFQRNILWWMSDPTYKVRFASQQASRRSSQHNSEVMALVGGARSFISCVVIALTRRVSSSRNAIYKRE